MPSQEDPFNQNTEHIQAQKPGDHTKEGPPTQKGRTLLIRLFLILIILGAGAFTAFTLLKTGPTAKRAPAVRRAKLVEVTPIHFSNHRVIVKGMGTVLPAQETDLYPRVSGAIQWVNPSFMPGGRFTTNEKILQIDPADYALLIRERTSGLEQANSNLKIEQGQQNVALREFELLGESIQAEDRDLILRLPQLENLQAERERAQSLLDKARLDLERTKITSPFNAIIKTREVNLGEAVTPATKLATLVGTDTYWVEVLIPVNQLQWLDIPGVNATTGSEVKIYDAAAWGKDRFRVGTVIQLNGELETEGRMARLLVSVSDPLGQKATTPEGKPPMLLMGAFVRVEMTGKELTHVVAIERAWLRNGDTVWLINAKNTLEIRTIEIAYRGQDQVFVSGGLEAGDRLVLTDLAAPVKGMSLRTSQEETLQENEKDLPLNPEASPPAPAEKQTK